MLLTLILNLDMAAGNLFVPPQPPAPSGSGGGVWRSRRWPKDPEHDDDLIPIIQAFLDKADTD